MKKRTAEDHEKEIKNRARKQAIAAFLFSSDVPFLKRLWLVISGARGMRLNIKCTFPREMPLDTCIKALKTELIKLSHEYFPLFLVSEEPDLEYDTCGCEERHHLLTIHGELARIDFHKDFLKTASLAAKKMEELDRHREPEAV